VHYLVWIAPFAALAFRRLRKLAVWCLVAAGLAWAEMALKQNAGIAIHHAILIWPIPYIPLAALLAEMTARTPLKWAVALLIASNLLVVQQYFYQLWKFGSPQIWSNAIDRLPGALGRIPSDEVVVMDWGIVPTLFLLGDGKLNLRWWEDPKDHSMFPHANAIWVGHVDGQEAFHNVNKKLREAALEDGYCIAPIAIIPDSNGRAILKVFRLERPLLK
jgi:hypothetical protein